MSKIKFRLVKFEKKIVFEVIDQIPIEGKKEFICNGLRIISYYPYIEDIKSGSIYIRSIEKSERNDRLSVAIFNSNDERDEYYLKILKALKEFSEDFKVD